VLHIGDRQRRARLATRHGIAGGHRHADPLSATRAMTVLHATEPATVYLSLAARVDRLTVADVDRALYAERSLVKQLAMRRTLFVFPRDLLPAAWGSASARVAAQLRARLGKEVVAAGVTDDGAGWLDATCSAVEALLADGSQLSAQDLREQVDGLSVRVEMSPGKPYGGVFPIAPRVLSQVAVEARIVRGPNQGHWRTSRPLWTSMARWLGESPEPWSPREGYAELTRRWLRTFGPGTRDDLQWWLGATAGIVRQALADVAAVEVSLDHGASGWVLPDDVADVAEPGPWAALLPVLDPTVMGWKERGFLLGLHGPALFDRNGNAGTTAWWDGRAVGCWVQDDDAVVRVVPLEPVGREARAALDAEADRLTTWLAGVRIGSVYTSPAMKAALS
jgi:hypothetical protein